jgi:hypothetical protein
VVSSVDITPAIMGAELATSPYMEPPPATDRDARARREPCQLRQISSKFCRAICETDSAIVAEGKLWPVSEPPPHREEGSSGIHWKLRGDRRHRL